MARGVSRHHRLSRQNAQRAWTVASGVVSRVTGVMVEATSGRVGAPGPNLQSCARQLAYYVATCGLNVAHKHLADAAGVHWTSVGSAVRNLEAARDEDPLLDELLQELTIAALADQKLDEPASPDLEPVEPIAPAASGVERVTVLKLRAIRLKIRRCRLEAVGWRCASQLARQAMQEPQAALLPPDFGADLRGFDREIRLTLYIGYELLNLGMESGGIAGGGADDKTLLNCCRAIEAARARDLALEEWLTGLRERGCVAVAASSVAA